MAHARRRRILATHSVVVVTLLASSAVTFNQGQTSLYMSPQGPTRIAPGETTAFDIMLSTTVPINAMSATLAFPPDLLEVVSISKERSFLDLWTEETAIREDVGEVHWSGGTYKKGGVTGTTTALTLRVKAKRAGMAQVYFKEAEVLESDGYGTEAETVDTPFTFEIAAPVAAGGGGAGAAPSAAAKPPTMDFSSDGKITIADLSIIVMHLAGPYDARYDLNRDGTISIADLSVLFANMR
jgi:hypothetical protein